MGSSLEVVSKHLPQLLETSLHEPGTMNKHQTFFEELAFGHREGFSVLTTSQLSQEAVKTSLQ